MTAFAGAFFGVTFGVVFTVGFADCVHVAGSAEDAPAAMPGFASVVVAGHVADPVPVPPEGGRQPVPPTPAGPGAVPGVDGVPGAGVVPGVGVVPGAGFVPAVVVTGTTTALPVVPQEAGMPAVAAATGVGVVGATGPLVAPVGVDAGTEPVGVGF
ncbi:MAG: hypothetical protein ACXVEH_14015 [Nocardioides sp.]